MKYKLLSSKYYNGKKYFMAGDMVDLSEDQYKAFSDMFEPKAEAKAEPKAIPKAEAKAEPKAK